MVGVAQGWVLAGFGDGVGETTDSFSGFLVAPHLLSMETDPTELGSPTRVFSFF